MQHALYYADLHGAQSTYLKVRALNTASKLYLSLGFFEKAAQLDANLTSDPAEFVVEQRAALHKFYVK
jgi:hypothetical protein